MAGITARQRLTLLAGAGCSAILGACGGGGSGSTASPSPAPTQSPTPDPTPTPTPTPTPSPTPTGSGFLLRDVYANDFLVGAAIRPAQLESGSEDLFILERQFSSLTAEAIMKMPELAPNEGSFNFTRADQLVDFAEANNAQMRGHTLLWHQTTPDYFLTGMVDDIREKLEDYVTSVASRYRDRIYAWDVVNEVAADNDLGPAPYRDSNWYQAVGGPDFIEWAFRAAHAAAPDAKLFLNDYNTEFPGKRGRVLAIVRDLLDKGVPIHGVGHQAHMQLNTNPQWVLNAIDEVDALGAGLENHITELGVSVYEDPSECFSSRINCSPTYLLPGGPPDTVLARQAQIFRDLFDGFRARPSVTSVTTWGCQTSNPGSTTSRSIEQITRFYGTVTAKKSQPFLQSQTPTM